MPKEKTPRAKASLGRQALAYHEADPPGKIEIRATKPMQNQWDLSLAYSPGVAEPCRKIHDEADDAYRYTAKGNLVGVISNGTAVLGLGDIGALAAKPVMEGKGVLFKKFAGIDVFDIEVDASDPEEFIRVVEKLGPTFGGINLEDVSAPECFHIEDELERRMNIPVFHDDQHGTAIIASAALMNALELNGKSLEKIQIVFSGAGAAAIATARLFVVLGAPKSNIMLCDSKGVVYAGRPGSMPDEKKEFARDTPARTLADALKGADVFVGVSVGGIVTADMVASMAENPIVFALANPDPEILPEDALAARDDVMMATGRSDYPNQVNNVLGFPYIFRGALDVRASHINEHMKLAAARALADLTKEDVPDLVIRAYGGEPIQFGREYLIPKPLDPRLLLVVAPAVAKAACDSGVARRELPGGSVASYREQLERFLGRTREVMRPIIHRARKQPMRLVFPEGWHPTVQRAARIVADERIAVPILLGRHAHVEETAHDEQIDLDGIELIDPGVDDRARKFAHELFVLRQRKGIGASEARRLIEDPDYFGAMMVHLGHADGMLSGVSHAYPETVRPALQVIGLAEGHSRVMGMHVVLTKSGAYFFADTSVNIDPSADELAEIAIVTADATKFFTDEPPRVAMLSFSNFGSSRHPHTDKVRKAVQLVRERRPDLVIDGEMRVEAALIPEYSQENFPFSRVAGRANVLVFPDLDSGNIAYKLMIYLARLEVIGPILLGIEKPVNVIQRGCTVGELVNLAAVTAVRAAETTRGK